MPRGYTFKTVESIGRTLRPKCLGEHDFPAQPTGMAKDAGAARAPTATLF
jgi:hypothetical protein